MIDLDEIGRIERRRERWEHRAPMTFGEAGQFYNEYLDDMATLLAALRELIGNQAAPFASTATDEMLRRLEREAGLR